MSPQLQCTPGAGAGSRESRECSVRAAGAEDRCGRGTGRDTQPPAPADLAVMSSKTRKNFSEQFQKQSGHFIVEFADTKKPNKWLLIISLNSGVTQHNFICQ